MKLLCRMLIINCTNCLNLGGDSQHCCPLQSKLWRGQSLPVPPMIYATGCTAIAVIKSDVVISLLIRLQSSTLCIPYIILEDTKARRDKTSFNSANLLAEAGISRIQKIKMMVARYSNDSWDVVAPW